MKIAVTSMSLLLGTLKQAKHTITSFTALWTGRAGRKRLKVAFFSCLMLAAAFGIATAPIAVAQTNQEEFLDSPAMADILKQGNFAEAINRIESNWNNEYQGYFGGSFSTQLKNVDSIKNSLATLSKQTGKKPAVIWIFLGKEELELFLVTPEGPPLHQSVPEAKREVMLEVTKDFLGKITNPRNSSYLPVAQQLYQWIIAPLSATLQAQKIDTLLFCNGRGLRTVPLAALHDGQHFLVEKYSLANIPGFSLTDTRYTDIRNAQILAMGASEFTDKNPLPGVPAELSAIAKSGRGESFLNQAFTLVNLQSRRLLQRFQIIHLATHAEFKPGAARNSYIQFWDGPLRLDQMRELRWNNPPVELLVLSACRTALGDKDVELGFGGLAVEAGVKSALASLWYVSDLGTLGLMSDFYYQLKTAPIKAEALRLAQMAMIGGKVQVENRQLRTSKGSLPLPAELATSDQENFTHPYYWAAFMLIGSPW